MIDAETKMAYYDVATANNDEQDFASSAIDEIRSLRTYIVGAPRHMTTLEVVIHLIVITSVVAVTIRFAIWFFYRYLPTKQKAEKTLRFKRGIYSYLQYFRVDDIDLRRAPTGGFLATYLNKLTEGVNECKRAKRRTSRTSSSSSDTDIEIDDDDVNDTEFWNEQVYNSPSAAAKTMLTGFKRQSLFTKATTSIDYMGVTSDDDDGDGSLFENGDILLTGNAII